MITPLEMALSKTSLKIVVTDSGLGGLPIAAEIEKILRNSGKYKELEMIFYNSSPSDLGYNNLESENEKIRVFDSALNGMKNLYNPDLIIIACNTLSVIFPKTKFSNEAGVPVVGIVESGTEMILEEAKKNAVSKIILLGTETTINSGVYKAKLIKRGIASERIISQPCKNLESEIQKNPECKIVREIIQRYISEAVSSAGEDLNDFIFAFCCTHYHLSIKIFNAVISKTVSQKYLIIDLNNALVNSIKINEATEQRFRTTVNCKVTTRYLIQPDENQYLSKLLLPVSPLFAQALIEYKLDPKLFLV